MFHTRLIIHHHIRILILTFHQLGLQQAINETIAAFSLSTTHDQQIKIILFHQAGIKLPFGIICLAHSRRNRIMRRHLSPGDLLTDIAQGHIHFHTENFVQVGIGICIYSQYRSFFCFTKILDQQPAQGRLSYAAFTGDSNNMCH